MLDGERLEDRQPVVRHLLVLHRATHQHIVIAVTPVIRHAGPETVDTLREEVEPQVAPLLHHLPALRAPFIGIGEQKVGGETGEHHLAAPDLPRLVTLALDGKVEIAGLAAFAARHLTAIHLVLPIDIAILTPRTDLGASMPRIPTFVDIVLLGHRS